MSYCLNPSCPNPQNPEAANFCQGCGASLILSDRYRALRLIGQGGFGKTFLAVDELETNKPRCVIKQFYPQSQGTHNYNKAADLFYQEAERLKELGKHDQIPNLITHFEQDGYLYAMCN